MGASVHEGAGRVMSSEQFQLPLFERAAVPERSLDFAIGNVTFRCHQVDGGQRYEWRSTDGRCTAGRNPGKGSHWAKTEGASVGQSFPTLRAAMLAAVAFQQLRAAA
jgi:hypothetical protein